ncbi:MAG: phenylalanine--tRNA ligase subunit beta [Candidatus Saccharimonas sp.]
MKVSLNTIRQYIDFELPPVDELVARINQQLGQVEEVVDLASKYKDVIIVKVLSCEKHPDADRLSVCLIDDGGVVPDIERNADGLVKVVCGAPNAREGIFAAWLPPRSTVPTSYGTAEPFVLDARELRGVKSNGMLAAADELALWSDHEGIIEIDPTEWRPTETQIKPGASFAKAFGLDDTIIDIENKMFTHRPDLFGQIGVAREISGILGHNFTSPSWYSTTPQFNSAEGLELTVFNEAGDKCPRFMTVALKDVTVKSSPLWLKIELVRLGGKPINNIVDVTNYVMLLTSQPTHAYDYDKLRGQTLGVRMAHIGESATLLNGKSYTLTADDIVIVDGESVVGLGGVMGGGNSEVSDTTTNIVLEVAAFDMYAVRKTSMRHGLFTDAVTRFNKGQSSLQQPYIMQLLMMSVKDVAGGQQAGTVEGMKNIELSEANAEVECPSEFINARLGLNLSNDDVKQLLERVEFSIDTQPSVNSQAPIAKVPFWRTDIELREDIVEEVGRLYGFDKLPLVLPKRSITPTPENSRRTTKQRVREALRRAGANEVLTYSFVHERTIASAGQDGSRAYQLSNALSPELQYYRLSVLPSLLDKVHMDIKAGFDAFALFEIGKAHSKVVGLDDEGLPSEMELVDLVISRKQATDGAPYYHARHVAEFLLKELHIDAAYKPIDKTDDDNDAWAPFDLTRSALIESRDGTYIGIVGELLPQVRARYKLPDYTAAASFSLDALQTLSSDTRQVYEPLSRYPSTSQDISLRVDDGVSYLDLYTTINDAAIAQAGHLDVSVQPVSIYQSKEDASHKTATFHLEFTSKEYTLQDSEVNPIMEAIASVAHGALGALRV